LHPTQDLNGDETVYGPHTWFFVKRPERSLPPDFDEAEEVSGLPTYEEAMRLWDGTAAGAVVAIASKMQSSVAISG
jgi:hypothetical protein